MLTPLVLIGYRATGKTTLAQMISGRLNLPSWDSDILIEQDRGKSIRTIFSEDGESVFRDYEEQIIANLFKEYSINDHTERKQEKGFILATGGGAILRPATRHLLRENAWVVWLKASPEAVFQRMNADKTTELRRPGLTNLPAREEIEHILQARIPLYEKTCHFSIDTERGTLDQIADAIFEQYARQCETKPPPR